MEDVESLIMRVGVAGVNEETFKWNSGKFCLMCSNVKICTLRSNGRQNAELFRLTIADQRASMTNFGTSVICRI